MVLLVVRVAVLHTLISCMLLLQTVPALGSCAAPGADAVMPVDVCSLGAPGVAGNGGLENPSSSLSIKSVLVPLAGRRHDGWLHGSVSSSCKVVGARGR